MSILHNRNKRLQTCAPYITVRAIALSTLVLEPQLSHFDLVNIFITDPAAIYALPIADLTVLKLILRSQIGKLSNRQINRTKSLRKTTDSRRGIPYYTLLFN